MRVEKMKVLSKREMIKETLVKQDVVKNLFRIREEWKNDFWKCIRDVATHPVVLRMKLYPHHGNSSCYDHCIHVAYYNYQWCRFFKLDYKSAARGGMLHDLFLYDWHKHTKKTGDHFHGLTHPKVALKNARKFFDLNPVEQDIIYRHMWPVTPFRIPHTMEGFITTWTDKYCGACETSRRKQRKK